MGRVSSTLGVRFGVSIDAHGWDGLCRVFFVIQWLGGVVDVLVEVGLASSSFNACFLCLGDLLDMAIHRILRPWSQYRFY